MKKIKWLLVGIFCLWGTFVQGKNLDQFNTPYFRIGSWRGSSFEELSKEKFPKAPLIYFKDSMEDLMEALRNNKIDAFMADRTAAADLIKNNLDLTIHSEIIDKTQYAMAFNPNRQNLRAEFAKEIQKMKADGSLHRLQQAWLSEDLSRKVSTTAPKGTRGLLRVGTSAVDAPFSFYLNNKLVGIEIELVNEIARRLDYSVEWSVVDHSSFIQALKEGKIDIDASLVTITPFRQTQVLFGETDYEDDVVFVVKKQKGKENGN